MISNFNETSRTDDNDRDDKLKSLETKHYVLLIGIQALLRISSDFFEKLTVANSEAYLSKAIKRLR